jgi:hypothetical protein
MKTPKQQIEEPHDLEKMLHAFGGRDASEVVIKTRVAETPATNRMSFLIYSSNCYRSVLAKSSECHTFAQSMQPVMCMKWTDALHDLTQKFRKLWFDAIGVLQQHGRENRS